MSVLTARINTPAGTGLFDSLMESVTPPPPPLTAVLLRGEHSQCHRSLLCKPGAVAAGPGAGGVAEGRSGPGPGGAAGRPAGLPHRRRLPGGPVPLGPGTGHGAVQSAPPTPGVDSPSVVKTRCSPPSAADPDSLLSYREASGQKEDLLRSSLEALESCSFNPNLEYK